MIVIITQALVSDKKHNLTAIWRLWDVKMTDDLILESRVILTVKSILQSQVVTWYEKTSISPAEEAIFLHSSLSTVILYICLSAQRDVES